MGRRLTPDQRAGQLASRQHGAITLAQALGLGLTMGQIRWRVRTGRWRLVARATFTVAGAPETWHQAVMVACLAGPSGTVASHLTAAALFGLLNPPPIPHVTVPRSASNRCKAAIVHRASLEPQDLAVIGAMHPPGPDRRRLRRSPWLRSAVRARRRRPLQVPRRSR